jgi:hypothetical protein
MAISYLKGKCIGIYMCKVVTNVLKRYRERKEGE